MFYFEDRHLDSDTCGCCDCSEKPSVSASVTFSGTYSYAAGGYGYVTGGDTNYCTTTITPYYYYGPDDVDTSDTMGYQVEQWVAHEIVTTDRIEPMPSTLGPQYNTTATYTTGQADSLEFEYEERTIHTLGKPPMVVKLRKYKE